MTTKAQEATLAALRTCRDIDSLASAIMRLSAPEAKPRDAYERRVQSLAWRLSSMQHRYAAVSDTAAVARRELSIDALAEIIRERVKNGSRSAVKAGLVPAAGASNVMAFPVDRARKPSAALGQRSGGRERDERLHAVLLQSLEDKFGHRHPISELDAPDGAA